MEAQPASSEDVERISLTVDRFAAQALAIIGFHNGSVAQNSNATTVTHANHTVQTAADETAAKEVGPIIWEDLLTAPENLGVDSVLPGGGENGTAPAPGSRGAGVGLPRLQDTTGSGPTIPAMNVCLGGKMQTPFEAPCESIGGAAIQPRTTGTGPLKPVEEVDQEIARAENITTDALSPSEPPASAPAQASEGEPSAEATSLESTLGEESQPSATLETQREALSRSGAGDVSRPVESEQQENPPPATNPSVDDPPPFGLAAVIPAILGHETSGPAILIGLAILATAAFAGAPEFRELIWSRIRGQWLRLRLWLQTGTGRRRVLALGLFSRITHGLAAKYPVRRLLLDLVKAQPGIFLQELSKKAGLSRAAVVYHYRILESAGLLKSIAFRKLRHLYATGEKSIERECFAELWAGQATDVAAFVLENPDSTQTEISRRLGIHKSRVSLVVGRLSEVGLLDVVRYGRRALCRGSPKLSALISEGLVVNPAVAPRSAEPAADWTPSGPSLVHAARL